MKVITRAAVGLAAVATAFTVAPFAHAQSSGGFQLDKTEYAPGDYVTISYDVTARCEGKAKSNGFINWYSSEFAVGGPNTYVAKANASFVPGTYTAELTCKGETVTRDFTVVAPRPKFTLDKAEYGPGDYVTISYDVTARCEGRASSNGFINRYSSEFAVGGPNTYVAKANASFVPGSYTAELTCGGKQEQVPFTVVANAPAQPPAQAPVQAVATKPKAGSQAKSPIVKPKGAPQTGGGATA
ncbi:hypothetical protein [Lentzea cavernae]|uniref:Ig-like domain-containing protein n=1 Tax=Lentzea cavernae TaxID=2020703 RepID=A0ABQ3MT66_9PSEU|nr:hypothetical protein [Lentzea cavernae]GHH58743.1 hypothetical protein GCM10017774_80590 [Lentzea cavernae]